MNRNLIVEQMRSIGSKLQEIPKFLALIPYALVCLALGMLLFIMISMIYVSAYVFTTIGVSLILVGIFTLIWEAVFLGLIFGCIGGFAYCEWLVRDDLPTITEILFIKMPSIYMRLRSKVFEVANFGKTTK